MKPTVCIPYRGSTVDRRVAFKIVTDWWGEHFPRFAIEVADSDPSGRFSRAGSRNAAARAVKRGPLIVCDADTMPDPEAVQEALAGDLGVMHTPFTTFFSLTREGTLGAGFLGEGLEAAKPDYVTTWSVGGCFIIDRDAYFEVGGQDEKFIGWGGEDVAFHLACETLLGRPVRHTGTAFGLWHPSDIRRGTAEDRAMRARQASYKRARGNPALMRRLIGL